MAELPRGETKERRASSKEIGREKVGTQKDPLFLLLYNGKSEK